jgi:hypothetical protein
MTSYSPASPNSREGARYERFLFVVAYGPAHNVWYREAPLYLDLSTLATLWERDYVTCLCSCANCLRADPPAQEEERSHVQTERPDRCGKRTIGTVDPLSITDVDAADPPR